MKRSLQSPVTSPDPLFVVSGVALIAATYGLARLGFGLFLPAFSESFALTPAISGTLASGASLLYCVSAGVGFRYAAARPRRVALLAGLSAALGSLGIAGAHTVPVLAASVLLAGTGAGFASPALVDLVRRNTAPHYNGRVQSIVNSGTGFGVVVAGGMSLVLGDAWRVAWILVALIAAVATIGVLRRDHGPEVHRPPLSRTPSVLPARARLSSISRAGFHGLGRPLVGALGLGVGSAAVWVYGRTILEGEGGMSSAASAGAWIALGVGSGSTTLLAPWLAARPLRTTWPTTALGTAGTTALLGAAPDVPVPAFAGALLFGLAYTAATSVLILWASAVAADSAAGSSALFIALVLGQATGAFLTGFALESMSPVLAFAAAALCCAAAAAAAVGVRTPTTADPAPLRESR